MAICAFFKRLCANRFARRALLSALIILLLLSVNLFCELLSALAIFLLVRIWVHRASGATGSRFLHRLPAENRAWICGLAAAGAVWLEPSMILDAHGWPQWDVWILPFYLFAAL